MLEKHDRKPIREIGLFSAVRHGGSPIVLLKSVRLKPDWMLRRWKACRSPKVSARHERLDFEVLQSQ